jgi:hypothetical protein
MVYEAFTMKFIKQAFTFIKSLKLLDIFLVLTALALFVFALSPLSTVFKAKLLVNDQNTEDLKHARKVLSIAQTVEESSGLSFKAVKLSTPQGIEIEIYNQSSEEPQADVDTHVLKNHSNGFFHLQGEPTAMAFMDADGNQTLDLVVSTYDLSLTPRLNVYRFDPSSKKFHPSMPTP